MKARTRKKKRSQRKCHDVQFFVRQNNYYDPEQVYAYKLIGGLDDLHQAYEDGDIDGSDVICTLKALNQYKIKEVMPRYVLRKI